MESNGFSSSLSVPESSLTASITDHHSGLFGEVLQLRLIFRYRKKLYHNRSTHFWNLVEFDTWSMYDPDFLDLN